MARARTPPNCNYCLPLSSQFEKCFWLTSLYRTHSKRNYNEAVENSTYGICTARQQQPFHDCAPCLLFEDESLTCEIEERRSHKQWASASTANQKTNMEIMSFCDLCVSRTHSDTRAEKENRKGRCLSYATSSEKRKLSSCALGRALGSLADFNDHGSGAEWISTQAINSSDEHHQPLNQSANHSVESNRR